MMPILAKRAPALMLVLSAWLICSAATFISGCSTGDSAARPDYHDVLRNAESQRPPDPDIDADQWSILIEDFNGNLRKYRLKADLPIHAPQHEAFTDIAISMRRGDGYKALRTVIRAASTELREQAADIASTSDSEPLIRTALATSTSITNWAIILPSEDETTADFNHLEYDAFIAFAELTQALKDH